MYAQPTQKARNIKPPTRPVSLTCLVSKVMEHILTSQLMTYAEHHNIFHSNQHGFRANHGCELQLIELVADVTNALDQGDEIKAGVLDFSKAFDRVNHQKLLYNSQIAGSTSNLPPG